MSLPNKITIPSLIISKKTFELLQNSNVEHLHEASLHAILRDIILLLMQVEIIYEHDEILP